MHKTKFALRILIPFFAMAVFLQLTTSCTQKQVRQHTKVSHSTEKPEIFARLGHLNGISSVAFSLDGKYVISGDKGYITNSQVKIWDSGTGKEIKTFKGPKFGAEFVTISPDNKYALALSMSELKAWDILKGKEILTTSLSSGATSPVWAAFSPDGKTISVLGSRTLDIWEISSGLKIKTIKGFSELQNMASSNKYASVFENGIIYDATTGEPVKRVKEGDFLDGSYFDLACKIPAFSDDGVYAALGKLYGDTIALRDFKNGTRSVIKTTGRLLKVDISHDGEFVGALVEVGKGSPLDDNKKYVFRVWGFNDSKEIGNVILQDMSYSLPVAPSPDWSHVVAGYEDGSVKILDIATSKELLSIVAEQDDQDMMAMGFDRYIATIPDKTWVIWDVHEGALVELAKLTKEILMPYFSKNSFNEEKTVMISSNATSSDHN
ncbi:MAG: hypothetical protein KAJ00_09850, partial [Deltaproteobacteria bacterium]|nr:hypothetical protein [Deltaproteobacteria bacterium]